MKAMTKFLSEYNDNINVIYYFCMISAVVLSIASLLCVFALSINFPVVVKIIFIVGAILFAKQAYDMAISTYNLSHFIKELVVFNDKLELSLVPNKKQILNKDQLQIHKQVDKNKLFQKVTPPFTNLIELKCGEKRYFLSLTQEFYESIKLEF